MSEQLVNRTRGPMSVIKNYAAKHPVWFIYDILTILMIAFPSAFAVPMLRTFKLYGFLDHDATAGTSTAVPSTSFLYD